MDDIRRKNKNVMKKYYLLMCTMSLLLCCSSSGEGIPRASLRFIESLQIDGINRRYVVKFPRAFDSLENVSLVIFLHGFAGNMEQAEKDYGFNEKSDTEGFVVVYPNGVQNDGIFGLRSWNAGRCCHYAEENNINDVGFIERMIDSLLLRYPKINKGKVYLTGISNGAMMCYRIAAELNDKISAIAPVSGPMMLETDFNASIPILHIHSLLDTKVPYNGGLGIGDYDYNSVAWTLEQWQDRNNCSAITQTTNYGNYSITQYLDCSGDNDILLYVTEDGGHSWPGGKLARVRADLSSTAFSATHIIWDFFKNH